MPATTELMIQLLVGCILGMAILGVLFLRTRRLAPAAYLSWGLLVVGLPLLGPFLVIIAAPGLPRRSSS